MSHKVVQGISRLLRPYRRHLAPTSAKFSQDAVTATRFWRNQPQLRALFQQVLPYLSSRLNRPIRIAVHGCSCGCEAYTLAMAATYFHFAGELDILGLDIDPHAIRRARRGTFSLGCFTRPGAADSLLMPQDLWRRFFHRTWTGRFAIDASVRDAIRFRTCDVTDHSAVRALGVFDLVFFQNALLHLTAHANEQAIRNLAASVSDVGLLILGGTPGDLLTSLALGSGLVPLELDNQAVYEAWSGRLELWRLSPTSPLGLEPFSAQHPQRSYRYAHAFAVPSTVSAWTPFLDARAA